ncbi:MAG: hypothetical protein AAF570_27005 [Bacteroidota bacterium]
MSENSLIKRRLKSKLPKGLSHPVGAQVISQYFADIPMFDDIELVLGEKFGKPMGIFMAGWGYKLKNPPREQGYRELALSKYDGSGRSYISEWSLEVNPVPSDYKNATRLVLFDYIFSTMKTWYCTSRPETWFEGYQFLQIGINNDFTSLFVLEFHNRWVVHKKVVSIQ